MKIKLINKSDLNEINKIDNISKIHGNIFNQFLWIKIFENSINIFGIYDDGDNLVGGFYLYEEKKFGFSIYRNPPFTPYIGPFLKIEAKNQVSIMNNWKKSLRLIADFIDNLNYSIISFSLNREIIDTQPFIWKKFKVIPNYTYILDLEKSMDNIKNEFSAERRNDIKKALKDGLKVEKINDNEIIRLLVNKTFSRQGKKLNEFYLRKILFDFSNDNNSFAFATFKNNIPIACSFCVYDNFTAYYLLGGYDDEIKHHGAGALSMLECLNYAKNLGLKYFDFEGSMVPNIEQYFRGFGGKLTPYFRVNKARFILEIFLKFFKREIF